MSFFIFLGFFFVANNFGVLFLKYFVTIKIPSSFSLLESFPPLRCHLYLILNVCEWDEVEIYFDSSQTENNLPWGISFTYPVLPSFIIYFCTTWKLSLSSMSCLTLLLSIALSVPQVFIKNLDMGRAHLLTLFFHFVLR